MENSPVYESWLSDGTMPIIRSYTPKFSGNRYDYNICVGFPNFDILRGFKLVLVDRQDIDKILEARLVIANCYTTIKLTPENFTKLSDYCYELEFVIEKNTNKQLMFPLVGIQIHCRFDIHLFVKNELEDHPKIICTYHNVDLVIRHGLHSGQFTIDTNYGPIKIIHGMIGWIFQSTVFSMPRDEFYEKIHQKLYAEYNKKILARNTFPLVIKYNDVSDIITDKEYLHDIITGLSYEWNVYVRKDPDGYVFFC